MSRAAVGARSRVVAAALVAAVIACGAVAAGEISPARELVERVLGYLGLRVEACSGTIAQAWPDRSTLCAPYGGSFSAFKLDVETTLRRHNISSAIKSIEPWTYSVGSYKHVVEVEGEQITVVFDEKQRRVVLALPAGEKGDLVAEVTTGRPSAPRLAGFGGVSVPRVRVDGRVRPDYPVAAYTEGIRGDVTLRALVRRDGSVGEVEVLRVDPDGFDFETAAVAAVQQWRFDPAELDGEAVDAMHTIRVTFDAAPPRDPGAEEPTTTGSDAT